MSYDAPRKPRHLGRKILLGIGALIVVIVVISVAAGGSKTHRPAAAQKPITATADQQLISKLKAITGSDGNSLYSDLQEVGDNPVTMASQVCGGSSNVNVPSGWSSSDEHAFLSAVTSTECPGVSAAPAGPQYTAAQQQAIDAANSYIQMGSGFSREGLIQQLDSSAGNGFSEALATFAVDHIRVNWDNQAKEAAQGYMQSEPGWSFNGLVQQLESSAGSGFTYAQAVYGAKSVGL
jgi:Host cell surface-exposed lipoprotein